MGPELLRQADLDKQIFAVNLISHLSVLTTEERQQLFPPVLPAFVRFCKAFPPLMEDVVGLLLQYGRICASEDSLQPLTSIHCKFISRRKSAKNVIYFFSL